MSSSFSTLAGSFLEMLSETLDILDRLHTVSIEFTVLRENSLPTGLEIHYQCLLAEQKPEKKTSDVAKFLEDVEKPIKTVSANC